MVGTALHRIGRAALDLLYPPQCVLCGRHGALLCQSCADSLPRAEGPRCVVCWLPVRAGAPCRRCQAHPIALARLRSPFVFESPARDLVLKFKFGHLSSLAEVMAPAMAVLVDWSVDAVVPVPLTSMHERRRGYNQSRLLARSVAAALGAKAAEALRRPRGAATQATSTKSERWRNVRDAFRLTAPTAVAGRRVLLVDDVATTCATLDACASVLLGGGALEVSAVTFARED